MLSYRCLGHKLVDLVLDGLGVISGVSQGLGHLHVLDEHPLIHATDLSPPVTAKKPDEYCAFCQLNYTPLGIY